MGSFPWTVARTEPSQKQNMLTKLLLLLAPWSQIGEAKSTDCSNKGGGFCIPIKSCNSVVKFLHKAKDYEKEEDFDKMKAIINTVKIKVCGDIKDRLICCKDSSEGTEKVDGSSSSLEHENYPLGNFVNYYHNIGGSAYALDRNTILIKGFTYDGEGPDAFFWAGNSPKPNIGATRKRYINAVLPYPFKGKHHSYNDRNIEILPFYDGTQDIILKVPDQYSVEDFKWLSVWCRDFKINFGHVTFPDNLRLN